MSKKSLISLAALFFLASAQSAPVAVDDLQGLGNSTLAAKLKNSIFLGEGTVQRSITRLLNTPDILESPDKKKELSELGFQCEESALQTCHYHGTAKTYIKGDGDTETTLITIDVSLDILIETEKIHVQAKLNRTSSKRGVQSRLDS